MWINERKKKLIVDKVVNNEQKQKTESFKLNEYEYEISDFMKCLVSWNVNEKSSHI